MEKIQPKNYQFNMIIIKPNTCEPDKSYNFEENYYKLLNCTSINEPLNINNEIKSTLLKYLLKKDYFETKTFNFNSLLHEIENYINPNKNEGHRYDIKTCLNNDNELIMFVYDELMAKNMNIFNHFATVLGPNYETVCGPVFITKMIKDENGMPYKHVDITYDDLINIWISLKQVECWVYFNNQWTIKMIFNNNKSFDKDYKHININTSLVFYKLKKKLYDVKKYLTENIDDNIKIAEYFEEIYICKLRTGEYINEELNYNTDMSCVQEHIINTATNGFDDFDKCQVVMESIFQNVNKKMIKF